MKEDKILISIVIPIYNVEQYIDKCLDTCLNQNIDNYEIIGVDDGSTDRSGMILDNYCRRYRERIIAIHTCNQGVSEARNTGIRKAKGEYIWFVDPDDYVQINILSDIAVVIATLDLLMLPWKGVVEDDNSQNIENRINEAHVIQLDDYEAYFQKHLPDRVWSMIVRKSIFTDNNLWFAKDIFHGEDRLFCFFLQKYIHSYAVLNRIAYYYRLREHSTSRGYIVDKRRIINWQNVAIYLNNHIGEYDNAAFVHEARRRQNNRIKASLRDMIQLGDIVFLKERLSELKRKGLYPYSIHYVTKSRNPIKNLIWYSMNVPLLVYFYCGLISIKKRIIK